MDNNTSYETQAIDINLLSVLDITKDGKVVSAEKWVELWNLVFQHINKIDAFCVDMQSTLDNWHESEIALNKIIEDMQMKYDALSTEFIHYGENTPENPNIMLWVHRMSDISTQGFLTDEDMDSALSSTSENPVQNKVVNAALNNKMDKNNPTGTGSFSLNRRSDTVVGDYSFAEGSNGQATGTASHAEGNSTTALGGGSHAEGHSTTASSDYQHVQGKYNIPDSNNIYADIIGNGSSYFERSNAHTLDWNGNAWYAGDVYVGSTSGTNKDDGSKKLATEEYVDEKTVVDQEFSAQSENAQSGIAIGNVLADLDNRVNEVNNYAVRTDMNLTDNYYTKTEVDEKTVVDQTYNPNSLNAQSGKAVAELANKRMPKVINANEKTAVVTVKGFTVDSMAGTEDSRYSCVVMSETDDLTGDFSIVNKSIPVRDSKGNLQSGDPAKDYDVAPKKYVDDALAQSGGSSTLNIKNSTGSSSLQQVQDTGYTGIAIKTKNPNAYGLDTTLTDNEPIGAIGDFASSFGGATSAQGKRSFACGTNTIAKGKYSFASGDNSVALGNASHAEGYATVSKGQNSHSEGYGTQAQGKYSHSEGNGTIANGESSHSEGELSKALGKASHAEGENTIASGKNAHAEGTKTQAIGNMSHSEGHGTKANLKGHAEGHFTEATGEAAHSEGANTKAIGDLSHSEGENTQSIGRNSHAEGWVTTAEGVSAHAEGFQTTASGIGSHAEGDNTKAEGKGSHAQGSGSVASGTYSSVAGNHTRAGYANQFVVGKFNSNKPNTYFEVGNGADDSNRSNAFEVYTDGHAEISAMGSTDKSVTTKKYVDDKIAEIPSGGGGEVWEVISDTTTEFDTPVSQIVINQDTNGNSFSLKKMRVFIDFTVSETHTGGFAKALTASSGLMYIGSQGFTAGSVYGYFIDSEVLPMVNNRCQIISHFNDTRMSENGNNFNFEYNSGAVDYGIRSEKMTVTALGYNVSSISNFDFRLGSGVKINKARILIFGVRA